MIALRHFILFFIFFFLCSCSPIHQEQEGQANLFPGVQLTDLEGKPFFLKDEKDRVFFVNFFGSWCVACQKEMKFISKLHRDYFPLTVFFVGIALDSRVSVHAFLKKTSVPYPVFLSNISAVQFLVKYGNAEGVLPFSLVFHEGIREATKGDLSHSLIRRILDTELCRRRLIR